MKITCLDSVYSTTRLLTTEQAKLGQSVGNEPAFQPFLNAGEGRKGEGGLRTKGYYKHGYSKHGDNWRVCVANGDTNEAIDLKQEVGGGKLPLITVVTVVYNGGSYLEETILSVINQTYPNVEYVIIDGGSSDGTLDIIRKYEHVIDYWVSEKDEGIYDAMNKGICAATGEWVNFMNAGDCFYSADTVALLFNNRSYIENVIYGGVLIRYADFSRIQRSGNTKNLWKGMQFCHQSAFVRTDIHRTAKFNIKNRLAADLEFFYGAYKKGVGFRQVDAVVSSVTAGGLSDTNRVETILAWGDAVSNCEGRSWVKVMYYLYAANSIMRGFIKKILPAKVVRLMIRVKK